MIRAARVHPAERLGGVLVAPGDKSLSHRVAILSGLAAGDSTIRNFLDSRDCLHSLRAMEALGAGVRREAPGEIRIRGTGGRFLEPAGPLDLGNSGTGIRLLAGLLAGVPITAELTGDESLRSRPMRRIREPLERMGAGIELLGRDGCAPIRLRGGGLKGIEYAAPVASAQVKSSILLAALSARGRTVLTESVETRDHTERLLKEMGVPVKTDGRRVELEGFGPGGPALRARDWRIPGDFSSAAYAMAAAAARPGCLVEIRDVGLNPRRTAFLNVLERMGAGVEVREDAAGWGGEPVGRVTIRGAELRCAEVGGAEIPNLIDELPLVAVLGAMAEGRTVIRDAGELRVKESDRLSAMAAGLRPFGVSVEEREDGMDVAGPVRHSPLRAVSGAGDHRIVMALAVLALQGRAPVTIRDIACVDTSYPGFWNDFRALGARIETGESGWRAPALP